MMTFLYPDSLRLYLFMVVVPRDSDESVETEFELRINGSKGGLRFESMVTEHVKQTNELMIWFHCPREYLVEVANSKKAMVKFRGDGHEELYILSPTGQALHRVFLDRFQAADGLPTK